jgi:hypothetical protein
MKASVRDLMDLERGYFYADVSVLIDKPSMTPREHKLKGAAGKRKPQNAFQEGVQALLKERVWSQPSSASLKFCTLLP